MARNTELVRQWEILREIDGARNGVSIPKLAALRGVHERTIRRDIDALCRAGFSLYDEKFNGTPKWKLRAKPFRGRRGHRPCGDGAVRALSEPPRPRRRRRRAAGRGARSCLRQDRARAAGEVISRSIDAALNHRRVTMRYFSVSSGRAKEYLVEPQRIAHAEGGLYLFAYVPEYGEIRAFAAERIKTLAVRDDHFKPRPLPSEPFGNSLGVFTGEPERIEILFNATTAPLVLDREWHRSQTFENKKDGAVLMTLNVCNDYALLRWVLSFGASATVMAPAELAESVRAELQNAAANYASNVSVMESPMLYLETARQLRPRQRGRRRAS